MINYRDTNREIYEENLRKRQREHLEQMKRNTWQSCIHDACTQCHGTGLKSDGSYCIHGVSCPCPKCSPY